MIRISIAPDAMEVGVVPGEERRHILTFRDTASGIEVACELNDKGAELTRSALGQQLGMPHLELATPAALASLPRRP